MASENDSDSDQAKPNRPIEIAASGVQVQARITFNDLTVAIDSAAVAGSDNRMTLIEEMLRVTSEAAVGALKASLEVLDELENQVSPDNGNGEGDK